MTPSLLTTRINEDIHIDDGVLVIGRERLTRFVIERQFPSGANGVAFAARHVLLDDPRVIKIWLANRSHDDRDKLQQGIAEARAMAVANPEWAAMIHDADVTQGYFWAAMELLDGHTLKDHLGVSRSKADLWWLARLYINGIGAITTPDAFHGDPHWGNVIVYEHSVERGETVTRVKFIDFGTSKVGLAITRDRHWQIATATFRKIVLCFDSFRGHTGSIDALHAKLEAAGNYPSELEYRNPVLLARFDDILDGLKVEAGLLGL